MIRSFVITLSLGAALSLAAAAPAFAFHVTAEEVGGAVGSTALGAVGGPVGGFAGGFVGKMVARAVTGRRHPQVTFEAPSQSEAVQPLTGERAIAAPAPLPVVDTGDPPPVQSLQVAQAPPGTLNWQMQHPGQPEPVS